MTGRGRARKTIELVEAARAILEEIRPATVRAVCYRLFTAGLIDSMAKSNTNKVSRLLVGAREDGTIPWTWVVDETREAERVAGWRDLAEFGGLIKRSYRKNYWSMQPHWVEVWSEKGTVRGTLAPVLDEYGVTFRVMHGHSSATAIHDVAAETQQRDRQLIALYVGDWDPSGMHMSEADLPRRFFRYVGHVDVRRIAIDTEDTEPQARLPHFAASDKIMDPRYRWFVENYGEDCFELDALDPNILRERVKLSIRNLIDRAAWDHAMKVEAAERDSMAEFMKRWPGTISMPATK